jgi:hypothetical protein
MSEIEEQLKAAFSETEVKTTNELLECLQGAPTSSKFRRIIMLLLRGHYSSSDNYGAEYAHLNCYSYKPDGSGTLHVDFTQQNEDFATDKLPGIYVAFGDVGFQKLGMGNDAGMSADMASNYYTKAAELDIIVHHVAKHAADAFDLADMSYMVLTALAEPFARRAGASALEVVGYGQPKKELEPPTRYYDVAMAVKISYTPSVTRSLESHRIRRIAMCITDS